MALTCPLPGIEAKGLLWSWGEREKEGSLQLPASSSPGKGNQSPQSHSSPLLGSPADQDQFPGLGGDRGEQELSQPQCHHHHLGRLGQLLELSSLPPVMPCAILHAFPSLWLKARLREGQILILYPHCGSPVPYIPALPLAPTDSSFTPVLVSVPAAVAVPGTSHPGAGLADGALCRSQSVNATGRWLSFPCLFSWCPKPPPHHRQAVPKCDRKLLRR